MARRSQDCKVVGTLPQAIYSCRVRVRYTRTRLNVAVNGSPLIGWLAVFAFPHVASLFVES